MSHSEIWFPAPLRTTQKCSNQSSVLLYYTLASFLPYRKVSRGVPKYDASSSLPPLNDSLITLSLHTAKNGSPNDFYIIHQASLGEAYV